MHDTHLDADQSFLILVSDSVTMSRQIEARSGGAVGEDVSAN
jgi:hypothetical protein